MSRPVIHWDGPGKPTRRELEAIRSAWQRGELRSGDHVCRARRNPAPSSAEYGYQDFHWGRRPRRRRAFKVRTPSEVFEIGKLRYVEYQTKKGNQDAIWCHRFSWPLPSLTGTTDGELGPILGGSARVTTRGIVG